MINPTEKDIGRRVVYIPLRGPREHGVITSFNEHAVFVRYDGETESQRTNREDLKWERDAR